VWVEPIVRVDNSLLQRDLARSGLGVVFLLSFVAERDLREGTLVPLFEGIEAEERSVHAVYPSPVMPRRRCVRSCTPSRGLSGSSWANAARPKQFPARGRASPLTAFGACERERAPRSLGRAPIVGARPHFLF